MHTVTINVQEGAINQVMYLLQNLSDIEIVNILPKNDQKVEESYPSISFEEAQDKVQRSVANISKSMGRDADRVFEEILDR
jgi:hypothetical protein